VADAILTEHLRVNDHMAEQSARMRACWQFVGRLKNFKQERFLKEKLPTQITSTQLDDD